MKRESWADYLQEMWSTSEEAKYQSQWPIYILHLFALATIGLFLLVYFQKKRWGSGKSRMKKVWEAGFSWKRGEFNWAFAHSTLRPSHTWTKEITDDVECYVWTFKQDPATPSAVQHGVQTALKCCTRQRWMNLDHHFGQKGTQLAIYLVNTSDFLSIFT